MGELGQAYQEKVDAPQKVTKVRQLTLLAFPPS